MKQQEIVVRGARTHNLKNIDVTIPRDQLVVITGPSGSGKSSLAFDTIYAEGQRRYVESLSAYARQFLGQMDKPDVDSIDGLSPAIAIDQKSTNRNPRSTVGTVTEIYDYLRLLFARVGIPHCPTHGIPIESQPIEHIVDRVMAYGEGTKVMILSPVVIGKKGEHTKVLEQIKQDGFVRIRLNGDIIEVASDLTLSKTKKHTIEIVVDRAIVRTESRTRLAESIEMALQHADGRVVVHRLDEASDQLFSSKMACIVCGTSVEPLQPRLFSFNSPFGACPTCDGLGVEYKVDVQLVCPNRSLTLKTQALEPWASTNAKSYYTKLLEAACHVFDIPQHVPVEQLEEKHWHLLLYGAPTGSPSLTFEYETMFGGVKKATVHFEGIVADLQRRYETSQNDSAHEFIGKFMSEQPCVSCHGRRLKPVSLAVTVGGKSIDQLTDMPIHETLQFFQALTLSEKSAHIALPIVGEIVSRLSFLCNVGLDYLTLGRSAGTLSGGESQRIRLATQIGSRLSGVLYVLDEPSIGLHQRDNDRLITTLKHMRDLGNTLLVVEHDEDTMWAADYVIDMGPGAGGHGGTVTGMGTPAVLQHNPLSLTGQYLSGKKYIPLPEKRRTSLGNRITVKGASANNLRHITVDFPIGVFTVVTGVSGSGKSSLVDTLIAGVSAVHQRRKLTGAVEAVLGCEQVERMVNIDQSPIGRTPRSNPLTYTGVFDLIRDLYAQTTTAKTRGYTKSRFSFNLVGGRCEACKGDGILKIEMHFLPDVYVPCEVCKGKRYNRETLEVQWKGLSIADVLELTVSEALHIFEAFPKITQSLAALHDVGLGYMALGQSAPTLSGGEAQRLKLAAELQRRSGPLRSRKQGTLFVLDEPTTGLHAEDIAKLLVVLQRLVDCGDTVVVIEHHLDVIKCADWVIDLGPEGGRGGGHIVATGIPEHVCTIPASWTGKYLARVLARDRQRLVTAGNNGTPS